MSKPEIFTTSHTVDKETLWRYGEELGRHIAEQLGRRIAEKIYQECQKGERIVSVGEPYSQNILELNQVETRMDVRVQELVRCKDCIHRCKADRGHPDTDWCKRLICGTVQPDFFCADGERGSE